MSLETPEKIRSLQRKLYCKAKAEPAFRFYVLYDKICRDDILLHAYRLARANAGAPGVDGVTFAQIEEAGPGGMAGGLARGIGFEDVPARSGAAGDDPESRMGASVRSAFQPFATGWFRPRPRSCWNRSSKPTSRTRPTATVPNAGRWTRSRRCTGISVRGYTDMVDADLSKYFDSIPHSELLKSVARRVVDRNVLRLIKMWLKAPIEERDADGTRRMSGGKGNKRGTPQGGVASPLLANIYMNRFLKYWRLSGCGEAFRAHVVSYADDFVILSRGRAAEALAWTKAVMTKLGLTINEAKTSLKDARKERFDFLGYSFGPHCFKKNGKWYLSASPSKKSMQRFKTKIGNLLVPANIDPWPEVLRSS